MCSILCTRQHTYPAPSHGIYSYYYTRRTVVNGNTTFQHTSFIIKNNNNSNDNNPTSGDVCILTAGVLINERQRQLHRGDAQCQPETTAREDARPYYYKLLYILYAPNGFRASVEAEENERGERKNTFPRQNAVCTLQVYGRMHTRTRIYGDTAVHARYTGTYRSGAGGKPEGHSQ